MLLYGLSLKKQEVKMTKNNIKKSLFMLIGIVFILSFAGCTQEAEKIVIGEGDWASNALHDQIAKLIIEEGYGVEVEIIMADTAIMVTGMKNDDIDLTMELWSDNIPTYDDDIANGDYVELSTNFDDNMQGLYVPTYVVEGENAVAPDLKTVEDLKNYAELFPNPEDKNTGIIYGGPEGWSATDFMHKKVTAYGLDELYQFRTIDSGATLAATIASAVAKGEPWVGYYWEPTWIMGVYDMTLLQDSEYNDADYENGIGAFPTVDVVVAARPEFVENHPEVADFLSNYNTSSALTSQGLAYMQNNDVEADEAAKWFLKENEELWKGWVTEKAYKKIMEALG